MLVLTVLLHSPFAPNFSSYDFSALDRHRGPSHPHAPAGQGELLSSRAKRDTPAGSGRNAGLDQAIEEERGYAAVSQ